MKVAVCLIVKNEEATIAEWIAYHLAIGFETAIIFNNGSTDRTSQIIAKFSTHYDVRLINWSNTSPTYQRDAYDFALKHLGKEFDWICFIDSDEFLVPIVDNSIVDVLLKISEASAIAVNWAVFGSSGLVTRPRCDLVMESFCRRSENSFGPNHHVKSIVRPQETIRNENPHFFDVRGAYISPEGKAIDWQIPGVTRDPPVFDVLQINHYFVKSVEDWRQKMTRGYHDTQRSGEEFAAYDRNEVSDNFILRFVPNTRAVLATLH